jgi:hypothetical protein
MPKYGCTSNLHTAHVDVATQQGALHQGYLTGGPTARVLTMKKHSKSHVHALGPQCHTSVGGNGNFGQQATWKIGRQGDYLMNNWIRAEISSVTAASALLNSGLFLRWTHNLGHNLFEDIELTFSQVPGASFDEFYLDFFSAFSVPAGKRNVYDNMIGNIPELVNPIVNIVASVSDQVLPAAVLNVPIPMPYSRDIGIALPTGGLIYNEVNIKACLRNWDELLCVSNASDSAVVGLAPGYSRQATRSDVLDEPTVTSLQLWGNYVVVTSDERRRMGRVPRDMIWEIIQSASDTSIQTPTNSAITYLRYSHAVKALFFACRNTSVKGQRSNYTSRSALCYNSNDLSATEFPAPNAFDPIGGGGIKYEGAVKLDMGADFFSMVQPYYFAYSAPSVTGYHLFSYSSNVVSIDHAGSTDFGKLTNVSLDVVLGDDTQAALTGAAIPSGSLPFVDEVGNPSALPPGYLAFVASSAHLLGSASGAGTAVNQDDGFNAQKQTFELKNCCLAHTVVRSISGGLGFPIF